MAEGMIIIWRLVDSQTTLETPQDRGFFKRIVDRLYYRMAKWMAYPKRRR